MELVKVKKGDPRQGEVHYHDIAILQLNSDKHIVHICRDYVHSMIYTSCYFMQA